MHRRASLAQNEGRWSHQVPQHAILGRLAFADRRHNGGGRLEGRRIRRLRSGRREHGARAVCWAPRPHRLGAQSTPAAGARRLDLRLAGPPLPLRRRLQAGGEAREQPTEGAPPAYAAPRPRPAAAADHHHAAHRRLVDRAHPLLHQLWRWRVQDEVRVVPELEAARRAGRRLERLHPLAAPCGREPKGARRPEPAAGPPHRRGGNVLKRNQAEGQRVVGGVEVVENRVGEDEVAPRRPPRAAHAATATPPPVLEKPPLRGGLDELALLDLDLARDDGGVQLLEQLARQVGAVIDAAVV
mmetsp:Transcript_30279/g.95528  ORF Transcript_30279/g.95528 Transcript_30279/m.95528 type:complete len:299 (+) Transcript_30279:125-1021(+)